MAGQPGNIIDYVRTRTGSFDERPFNDVDALVLASLAYQTMPDVVPTLVDWERRYGTLSARLHTLTADMSHALTAPLASLRTLRHPPFPDATLADAAAALSPQDFDYNAGYTGLADPKLTEMLFAQTSRNPRFSSIRVGAVDEQFSREHQTQFAAMTFLLPDGTLAVAFRGTDTSFVGWKEDFNMAFQYPVPRCPPSGSRPSTWRVWRGCGGATWCCSAIRRAGIWLCMRPWSPMTPCATGSAASIRWMDRDSPPRWCRVTDTAPWPTGSSKSFRIRRLWA